MKYLVIVFLFISSFISGQGIEPTSLQPTQYQGGILRGVIPYVDEFTGETLYIYQHVDSLVFIKDSIYVRNDSILLRDGQGSVKMSAGWGLTVSSAGDSITYVADTTKLATLTDIIRGRGVATRVAFWGATDSLSSNANLYWDNNNTRLGINNSSPGRSIDVIGMMNLSNNAGGPWNTFINGGNNTLSGTANLAIGSNQTLVSITSGSNNVALGNAAGFSTSSGSQNFYLGYLSGYSNVSGIDNVFIGSESGYLNTGNNNLFLGSQAGRNGVNISNSVAIGSLSGYSGGTNNVDIGFYTGFNGTGSENVRIGRQAGQLSSSGTQNTYLGYAAGQINTGSYNTIIGFQAGLTGDGDENVFIGRFAGFSETGSNKLYIDNGTGNPLIGGDFTSNRVGINAAVTDISRTFDVNGEVRIRDLTTTTATNIVGSDSDGVLSNVTVGNGLTLSGGSVVTANISGSLNRVAKFTPNGTTVGNSQIYDDGTYIGINNLSPSYTLDINGDVRIQSRTGTAATGAGFTADGKIVAYSLDTAQTLPNTYITSGDYISITGVGKIDTPYIITNTMPEATRVQDSGTIDMTRSNDTISAIIIAGSVGANELSSSGVSAGSYTLMNATLDTDGRVTLASNGSAVTSITAQSPLTGGVITSVGTIGIQDAFANGSTKGTSTFTAADFSDNGSGLISIDYTNGQSASGSTKGFLTSTDWNTFNSKVGGTGTATRIPFWSNSSTLSSSPNLYWSDLYNQLGIGTITPETYLQGSSTGIAIYNTTDPRFALSNNTTSWLTYFAGGNNYHLWNSTSGIVLSATTGSRVGVNNSNPSYSFDVNGDVRISNRTGTPQFNAAFDSNGKLVSTGLAPTTGTVTSVGLTAGTGISVSGSPVTSSGNITVTNTGVTSLNGLGGTMFLSTGNSGIYPNWSSSGTTLYYNLPSGSSGQVLKHNGTGWTAGTDNTGTQNLSLNTESAGSIYMDITGGSGIYFSQGTGIDLVRSASNVLTVNSTFTNTDNQTLTFISPTLSISNGNSVTLPVLPSGTTRQTLRNNGSSWVASSLLENDASRIDINGWVAALRTTILGSRLLVNGYIQYDPVGSQATTVAGRDANGGLTGVTVGSGLSLSSGTLSASPIYAEVSYIGPSSAITTWTSIPFNQTAISNGMSTSSSGITIPSNGTYKIEYSVWGNFGNNNITGYSGMQTRVFGSGIKGTRAERVYHSGTQQQDLTISHQSVWANLTTGTLVNLDVQQFTSSGATLTISAANLIVTKL